MPSRVLVVGFGFIGSHVARTLAAKGMTVTVLTRSEPSTVAAPSHDTQVVIGDASDTRVLADALCGAKHVVYCAGGLFPEQSNLHLLRDIGPTLRPLITVLEELRRNPEISITFLSSGGTVYGPTERRTVDEAHPTDPVTSYGVLKLTSEKYISMYAHLYDIQANILRCSNVYGPGQPPTRGQGVIAAFLHRLALGQRVAVFGDGSVFRDFLYVSDVCAVLMDLMGTIDGCRLINVGSGEGTTISELLKIIGRVTGCQLMVDYLPSRSFDVPGIVLDISRLKRLMNFNPIVLGEGIGDTWDHVHRSLGAR